MRRAAIAAGTVVDPARLRARERDQLLHRTCSKGRMRDERVGGPRHQRHGRKVPRGVVRDFSNQGIDDEAPRSDRKQRVAVGHRLGDEVGADVAARAGTVLDHDRLPPGLGKLLGDQAHDDIVRPARSERHDDAHGPGRIVLRVRAQPEQDRAERHAEADADSSAKLRHSLHASPDPSSEPKGDTLNDKRRRFRMLLLATLCAAFLSGPGAGAFAQAYPNRPIHIIAPFPAGGGYDFLSRLVGAEMSKTFGQPVVVENKAGANGNIGTDAAAKSAPDGYTLLMGGNSPLALNVRLYAKLPYDPVKDFEPVARVATQPNLFAANPKVPVKSVAELVQYAKANPGKLTYASNGNGSPQHLAAEQLKRMAGVDLVHVPFKGAAPPPAPLLPGEGLVAFYARPLPLPPVHAGQTARLRAPGDPRDRRP